MFQVSTNGTNPTTEKPSVTCGDQTYQNHNSLWSDNDAQQSQIISNDDQNHILLEP